MLPDVLEKRAMILLCLRDWQRSGLGLEGAIVFVSYLESILHVDCRT